VHTAVGTGCESCHVAASTDGKTTITLRATGGELCSKCHEMNRDSVLHGPYKTGQCLICHNPHSGAYEAQTRAAASTLCLSCHMLNQPEARVNAQAKTVSLLDGITYDLSKWEDAPKIAASHFENKLSGRSSAPAAAKESGKTNPGANCLACHDPHSSRAEHLLRKVAEARGEGYPSAGSGGQR
jgi:predicted CXXCH cytochrome family protein